MSAYEGPEILPLSAASGQDEANANTRVRTGAGDKAACRNEEPGKRTRNNTCTTSGTGFNNSCFSSGCGEPLAQEAGDNEEEEEEEEEEDQGRP